MLEQQIDKRGLSANIYPVKHVGKILRQFFIIVSFAFKCIVSGGNRVSPIPLSFAPKGKQQNRIANNKPMKISKNKQIT